MCLACGRCGAGGAVVESGARPTPTSEEGGGAEVAAANGNGGDALKSEGGKVAEVTHTHTHTNTCAYK